MKNYRLTSPFAYSVVGGVLDTLEGYAGPASKPLSYPLAAAHF